ncbi:MAG: hypothetical protein HZC36_11210 [Armatimonadetes bacterium]|nr:hypothetical protein [Armatimonadota bacterium]
MKKIFTILLALSALSLVIGGCGGGAADEGAKPADNAAPAEGGEAK